MFLSSLSRPPPDRLRKNLIVIIFIEWQVEWRLLLMADVIVIIPSDNKLLSYQE